MVRRWIAALAGLLIAFALSAQNHKITLQLQDATTAEPVGFATVSLTPEKGQAKYTLSDGDGHALLEKVKSGKYTLKAEIMGYKTFQKALELKADVNLGIVKLESRHLDATDALAIALCHHFETSRPVAVPKGKGGWEQFLKEHPERVSK